MFFGEIVTVSEEDGEGTYNLWTCKTSTLKEASRKFGRTLHSAESLLEVCGYKLEMRPFSMLSCFL